MDDKTVTYSILPKRSSESKLVEGEALSASLQDPCPSCLREPKSRHLDSRYIIYPLIIRHCPDNHGYLVILIQTNRLMQIRRKMKK